MQNQQNKIFKQQKICNIESFLFVLCSLQTFYRKNVYKSSDNEIDRKNF
jgi:hypothetical protein